MSKRLFEIIIGFIVIIVVLIFVGYGISKIYHKSEASYLVKAEFNEVGGLNPGSPVLIRGVKVGEVKAVEIDTSNNNVKITMAINQVKIPIDSKVAIKDTDFFSGRKIQITPGKSKELVKDNGILTDTSDYMYLEDKINSIIFSK